MEVKAKLSYLRIAPRKVRLVADLIRGKKVEEAQAILGFTTKGAVEPMVKLLKSVMASAVNNFQLEGSNLYIAKIVVNEGPKLKRWRARARGRAFEIQKKTSHIIITLDEIKKSPKKSKEIQGKKKLSRPAKVKKQIETTTKEEKEKTKAEAKEKPKLEMQKPTTPMGAKRFFRRKSF